MELYSIGIDTGGTFTDVTLINNQTGFCSYFKLPTSTNHPAKGILEGIESIISQQKVDAKKIGLVIHGTTLGTNALLQGRYAKTGMITTSGFGDILELARQRRPHFFKLDVQKPTPVIEKDLRVEIDERIDYSGNIITPLDKAKIIEGLNHFKNKNVEAIVINFLHSYANPTHEIEAKKLIIDNWPEIYCCTSSEVLSEFREFERFSTTSINASLMPIMDRYLAEFENGVGNIGIKAKPRVLQSNGGAVSCQAIRKMPVNTFNSGPAGGVIGSVNVAKKLKLDNLITFDMGGTSTDVCLILKGTPSKKNIRDIGGFPVRSRTIDVHNIGAGGGSIAWIDPGGLLKVGPRSSGAYPGPACYNRGGTLPTVTDANLVLGRLSSDVKLAGSVVLNKELALKALKPLAKTLKIDEIEAAAGIIEIVNTNMMGAVRVISVEQGFDPREFPMLAFGGAGPLHGVEVAKAMELSKVIISPRPGLLSAVGLLQADQRADFSVTKILPLEKSSIGPIINACKILQEKAEKWISDEDLKESSVLFELATEMRYLGQSLDLLVPLAEKDLNELKLKEMSKIFHRIHEERFGYCLDNHPLEIVNIRLVAKTRNNDTDIKQINSENLDKDNDKIAERKVWFPDSGFIKTRIVQRQELEFNSVFNGPAIIEQMDTTTVIPPYASFYIDDFGNIQIKLK